MLSFNYPFEMDGVIKWALVVHSIHGDLHSETFQAIDAEQRTNLAYDAVIIIRQASKNKINELFSLPDVEKRIRKLPTIGITEITYSPIGQSFEQINAIAGIGAKLDYDVRGILEFGGVEIARRSEIIEESPGSVLFQKPSGRSSNVFIRASKALQSTEYVAFLALRLRAYISEEIKIIYVDTGNIISVVHEAIRSSGRMNDGHEIRVISFHSYEGLDKIEIPSDKESVLFIISASSSGSMGKKILRKHEVNSTHVVNLFCPSDQVPDSDGGQIVWDISKISIKPWKNFSDHSAGAGIIRLGTDDFSSVAAKPRRAIFGLSSKLSKASAKILSSSTWQNIVSCHRSVRHNEPPSSVYFDEIKLIYGNEMHKWLADTIAPTCPHRTKYISYDPLSVGGSELAGLLAQKMGGGIPPIDFQKIDVGALIDGDAIVCILPVVRDADSVMSMSRHLRTKKRIHIRFIVGVFIGEDQYDIDKLISSVCQSQAGSIFEVFAFFKIAIGTLYHQNPWDRERNFLFGRSLPQAKKRLAILAGTGIGLSGKSVFGCEEVRLRDGFVFWGDYSSENVNFANVVITIAGVLQNARSIAGDDGLMVSSHDSVMIDPHCFYRFNDSAIQASILRTAFDNELDYSRCPETSRRMKRLIVDVMDGYGSERGEACYEFLLCICLGKIRMAKSDEEEMLKKIGADESWKWLLAADSDMPV